MGEGLKRDTVTFTGRVAKVESAKLHQPLAGLISRFQQHLLGRFIEPVKCMIENCVEHTFTGREMVPERALSDANPAGYGLL